MPYEPVEVVWPRGTRIDLVTDDFGLLAQIAAHSLCHPSGLFERRSVGHVDDDLKLTLVVEGKHFDLYPLERNEGPRRQQQHNNAAKKSPPPRRIPDQRIHQAAIEPRGPALGFMPGLRAICVMAQ